VKRSQLGVRWQTGGHEIKILLLHETKNTASARSWNERVKIRTTTIKGLQSLLDQVNILSEIASSFSAFAKMPIPKTEHLICQRF